MMKRAILAMTSVAAGLLFLAGCGTECSTNAECVQKYGANYTCTAAGACLQGTTDAGPTDAGPTDAGPTDAGPTDAGYCTNETCNATETCGDNGEGGLSCFAADAGGSSGDIAAVRAAAVGPIDISVSGALVTYLRPASAGGDPAGFWVQAEASGPAMFVAVDPATLDPSPQVGDRVSFVAKERGVSGSAVTVPSIEGYGRASAGHPVQEDAPLGLVTDVSSADVVSDLDNLESELVRLTADVDGAMPGFSNAGTGHMSVALTSAGVATSSTSFVIRMPWYFLDEVDLDTGCSFELVGPMWRFNASAQPSVYLPEDIDVTGCTEATTVVSAVSTSATEVRVQFNRTVTTVNADGSEFAFSPAITASAASANGRWVTVTTTAQDSAATYTVTVASTVLGRGAAVDSVLNTATFGGFKSAPAVLMLNEVAPARASSMDLVELKVVTAGSMAGIRLEQDLSRPFTKLLATLPNVEVAVDDLIVVHLSPDATSETETAAKDEHPSTPTTTANYDTAWDVNGEDDHITYSGRLIIVRAPLGDIQDAAAFVRNSGAPQQIQFQLQGLQNRGLWLPADCRGTTSIPTPCTTSTSADPNVYSVAANWDLAATTTNRSVYRVANTMTKDDWVVSPADTNYFGGPKP